MNSARTILVTGGAGFIGSNLCHRLIDSSFRVICLDNFDDYYPEHIKLGNIQTLQNSLLFELVKGDIRDSVILDQIFSKRKIDFVVHLAAKAGVRHSMVYPQEYFDVNVNGSSCLLQSMLKHGLNKLIFASSSSVYGDKNGALNESENCDHPISPYAASKRAVELLNHDYHINSNFNVINLRLFSVYEPNQRPDLVVYKFMNQIIRNETLEIYGDLEMTRDYTHVDDVVDAILSSLELLGNSKERLYENINVGNSKPISLKTLIELIKSVTCENEIELIKKPHFHGDVKHTHADIRKARALLNFEPKTSIETGVFLFYQWIKSTHINRV